MNDNEELKDRSAESADQPAKDLLPDRDVLMMEKPMSDNRAASFRPADKKLLRNIVLILLFLIAMLIVLMVLVRSDSAGDDGIPATDTEQVLRKGAE